MYKQMEDLGQSQTASQAWHAMTVHPGDDCYHALQGLQCMMKPADICWLRPACGSGRCLRLRMLSTRTACAAGCAGSLLVHSHVTAALMTTPVAHRTLVVLVNRTSSLAASSCPILTFYDRSPRVCLCKRWHPAVDLQSRMSNAACMAPPGTTHGCGLLNSMKVQHVQEFWCHESSLSEEH